MTVLEKSARNQLDKAVQAARRAATAEQIGPCGHFPWSRRRNLHISHPNKANCAGNFALSAVD